MAVKTRAVSVADTATRLDTTDETDSVSGSSLAFYNNGASTIYVGGSDVSTANGAPVAAPIGTLFCREDGGAGSTLYVKESGTGNTGWAAK